MNSPDSSVASLPRNDLLRALAATPRATGSQAIAAARDRVARELEAAGFQRRDIPFQFSAFPGRWATPLFGAVALLTVQAAGHFGSRGYVAATLTLTIVALAVLALWGRWLARHGTRTLGLMRETGVLAEFRRPQMPEPTVWLCAHLDTKSQPVPTLVRAIGIATTGIGFALTVGLLIAGAFGLHATVGWWIASAFVTLAGAVPVMLSVVTNRSPGALDNASGVAAVVEAATLLGGANVGVLITDAEELGLAGARAWAAMNGTRRGVVVLNCDGVDDGGENLVMYSGRKPKGLLDAVAAASTSTAIPCRARRLPFGVLTDSVAFADAGLASVTFSRGSRASLLRVHTRRDDLERLRGTGIAPVARLLAATARQLI